MINTTIKDFFASLGYSIDSMEIDVPYDVSEQKYQVLTQGNTWANITKIIRKEPSYSYIVPEVNLAVGPLHSFWVRMDGVEPHWVYAISLSAISNFELQHNTQGWMPCTIHKSECQTEILDIEVEGTHCYYSNGVLSHNTMFGDPDAPVGGKSLPFHASVRIKLWGGQAILNEHKEVVGIHVSAKTIKNKVAPPFRTAKFEIRFGIGINEQEQMFDLLREHCSSHGPYIDEEGNAIEVSGLQGWKTLNVTNQTTGEVIVDDVKFHKHDFKSKILDDPKLGRWARKLLALVLVRQPSVVDTTSYAEVDAALNAIDEELSGRVEEEF